MPNIEWNKRWAKDLNNWVSKKPFFYYGYQWGDPGKGPLSWIYRIIFRRKPAGDPSKVVEDYIRPYVNFSSVVLEIGPGGGRWTKYLLNAKKIILVELNPDFFQYLKTRFNKHIDKLEFYQTSGYEVDKIDDNSVNSVFSFGTFVHIDPEGINQYLAQIRRVLTPSGIAVIQYADKTKKKAKEDPGFSNMDQQKMEEYVSQNKLRMLTDDTLLFNNSNICVLQKI